MTMTMTMDHGWTMDHDHEIIDMSVQSTVDCRRRGYHQEYQQQQQ
jgi:hypothetical protein